MKDCNCGFGLFGGLNAADWRVAVRFVSVDRDFEVPKKAIAWSDD